MGLFCLLRLLKERSAEPDRKQAFIQMHSLKLITFQGSIDLESGLVGIGLILVFSCCDAKIRPNSQING
jgi:hypothetical protein